MHIIKTNVAEALIDIMLNDVLTRMPHEIKYRKKKKITPHVIKCVKQGTFTPIIPVAKILTEILNQQFTIYDYTGSKEEKFEILPPEPNKDTKHITIYITKND